MTLRLMKGFSKQGKVKSSVLALLLLGAVSQLGQGLWIYAKAELAQHLIAVAWSESRPDQTVKPWPWADTWPVAQLQVPRLGVEMIALQGLEGNSLAFAPGMISINQPGGSHQSHIMAGHKDTHFRFLADLLIDDEILLKNPQGQVERYRVSTASVVDSRLQPLRVDREEDSLLLITCYPFISLQTGGPLRYLVRARKQLSTGELVSESAPRKLHYL